MINTNTQESFSHKITRGIAVIGTMLAIGTAHASTEEYLLMSKAQGGSKISKVGARSPVPFNKSYRELSDEQRAIFNAQFAGLASNDRPPFPANGLRAIYRPILKKNKSLSSQGVLNMAIAIDKHGNVDSVTVIDTPNAELERQATRVLQNTKFEPASCDGQPCAMSFPVHLVLL